MNAHVSPPTGKPRSLTAQERVNRALQRISEIPAAAALRVTDHPPAAAAQALDLAAAAHLATAIRYHTEALAFEDEGRVSAWLEFAGYHAITSSAFRAKADELRSAL
jgi:hypothetical protein